MRRCVLFLVLAGTLFPDVRADHYDRQYCTYDSGERQIITIGEYAKTHPRRVILQPALIAETNESYDVTVQVFFRDGTVVRPRNDRELNILREHAQQMNLWLEDLLRDKCDGWERVRDLKKALAVVRTAYPGYVRERMKERDAFPVEVVDVEILRDESQYDLE